jgi:mannitol-1-phosphate 5-dehydrogenase
MPKKIIVFGAGATGRGHVGLLCWQAGFDIVFVDKNKELVRLLRQNRSYNVKLYGRGCAEITVTGFKIYDAEDRSQIASEIVDSELVLTAVFDQNLPDVAQTLAQSVVWCEKNGRKTPLNIIACENMMDSSSTLGKHVRKLLDNDRLDYFDTYFGFPDSMISRVVPRPEPDPLVIITEDYNEWTARKETFNGEKPAGLTSLELVENQTARLERKLFIHNGGHAVCGYMGFHRQQNYIHEALQDPVVLEHVLGALDELGEVIRVKYSFSKESIESYKQDLGRRGAIPELKDSILRVVRDPIRKLSSRERLVAPAKQAVEYNLPHQWIVKGIVAALKYHHPGDQQSLLLAEKIQKDGLASVLLEVCQIEPGTQLQSEILKEWKDWKID